MQLPEKGEASGFTLVELMITIAVAAVLLVLATPSFIDFMDKARLRGVADNAVDFINKARAESVKQNRDVNIAFGGTTTSWCIGANTPNEATISPGDLIPAVSACACNTTPASCVVAGQRATLDAAAIAGVTIDSVPASFTFDSRLGTVFPLRTTVMKFSSPRKKFDLQLTVTPLGQPGLCVPPSSKRAFPEFSPC